MRMPKEKEADVVEGVEDELEKKRLELVRALLSQPSAQDPSIELARLSFLERFMRDMEGRKKEEDTESRILSKALTFAMVTQALQSAAPKQSFDPTQLVALINAFKEDSKSWEKFMQLYLQTQQQYYQQQAQLTQQLMGGLFGKQKSEIEELKERTERMIEQLNNRIDLLISQGLNKQPGVKEYIHEMIELRDTLKEAVEKLGVVEKAPEITDQSGKLQLGKLLDRGLRIAEKFIEKMPAKTPEPKPVQFMPVEQPKAESIEPIEKKLEKIEQKIEEMPKVEMIIPETPKEAIKVEEETQEYGSESIEEGAPESAGEQEAS